MQISRTVRSFAGQPPKQPTPPGTEPAPQPPKPAPPKEEHSLRDAVETVILTGLGGTAGYFMGSRFALAMSPPMAPFLGAVSAVAGAATAYVLAVDMHSPIP